MVFHTHLVAYLDKLQWLSGSERMDVLGMKKPPPVLHIMDILKCWNGERQGMSLEILVGKQHWMDNLRCSSGPETMDALGMRILVHVLHTMDIWKCWSGPERMDAVGMRTIKLAAMNGHSNKVGQREWMPLVYEYLFKSGTTWKSWGATVGEREWILGMRILVAKRILRTSWGDKVGQNNRCPWNEDTCKLAAANGQLKVIKWARNNGCLGRRTLVQ